MIPRSSCIIAAVLVIAGLVVTVHANAQTATQPVTITSADQALAQDIANGAVWTTQPTTTLAGAMTVLSTNSNGGKGQNCNGNSGNGHGSACPASP